jgi:hypothetical protein
MTNSVEKIIRPVKIIESAKNELSSIKGVCKVVPLDTIDIERINNLETLDEQIGCKVIGKKYNFGVRKTLSCEVVLAFMVDKEYNWPVNTVKLFHKGKMIGEDTQDQSVIAKFSECKDSLIMGNIIFYDREVLRISDQNDPICMVITEQPCPKLNSLRGVSNAVIGIPSSYTHDYLQLKITEDKKQMLGSFLVGFDIDQRVLSLCPTTDVHSNIDIKDRKCQLPL